MSFSLDIDPFVSGEYGVGLIQPAISGTGSLIVRNIVDSNCAHTIPVGIGSSISRKRAATELAVLLTVMLATLWLGSKHVVGKSGQAILNICVILTLFGLLFRQRQSWREWGILPDRPFAGAISIIVSTLLACAAIWLVGVSFDSIGAIQSYPWWLSRNWYIDLAQQILLQLILMPRIERIFAGDQGAPEKRDLRIALVAASVFSLLHAPNVLLMALTFAAGVYWCLWFRRYANLWLVWLSHLALASAAIWCLNGPWLANLRVGISYLLRSF